MFETMPKNPEEAEQKQIGSEAGLPPSPPEEEFISVMPGKFRTGKKIIPEKIAETPKASIVKPTVKSRKNILLVIIIVGLVLIISAGGFFFYQWAKNYLQKSQISIVQPESQVTLPQESAELRLTAEIRNPDSQQVISTGEIYFPTGALELGQVVEFTGLIPMEMSTSTYSYLGGVYKISPEAPLIKKPVEIKITYSNDLVQPEWEKDLKFGYFKNNLWTVLPAAVFDFDNNTVSLTLELIPADTFGIIVEVSKILVEEETIKIGPQIDSTLDTDNDGLTDTEELIYQTNPNNPDSDFDGQADGLEIISLTDPTHSEGTLVLSGLIKIYTNPTWSYSFYYPADWVVKALPETQNGQIMVITNTGEFFEVSIQDNQEKLSAKDWYLQKASQISPSQIREVTIADQPAVWGPDYLHLYISKNDKIYILTYNIGTEEKANFKITFQMIIKSFQFIEIEEPPEGQYRGSLPNGTLIKYPDATAVYLLENGKKRPIKSEEVYQRLGYPMWDVVEIPLEEWYPSGQMIE